MRRRQVEAPQKYKRKIEQMLYGNHEEALSAKQSLVMTARNIQQSNPEEAALLKRIYKRVRL